MSEIAGNICAFSPAYIYLIIIVEHENYHTVHVGRTGGGGCSCSLVPRLSNNVGAEKRAW